jgi:hypothetical protein
MTVTEPFLMKILMGENLLKLVYPNILIEIHTESCTRYNRHLTDGGGVESGRSLQALSVLKDRIHHSFINV